jgi:hypothetical protein
MYDERVSPTIGRFQLCDDVDISVSVDARLEKHRHRLRGNNANRVSGGPIPVVELLECQRPADCEDERLESVDDDRVNGVRCLEDGGGRLS